MGCEEEKEGSAPLPGVTAAAPAAGAGGGCAIKFAFSIMPPASSLALATASSFSRLEVASSLENLSSAAIFSASAVASLPSSACTCARAHAQGPDPKSSQGKASKALRAKACYLELQLGDGLGMLVLERPQDTRLVLLHTEQLLRQLGARLLRARELCLCGELRAALLVRIITNCNKK